MRLGLHELFIALMVLAIIRVGIQDHALLPAVLATSAVLAGTYALGLVASVQRHAGIWLLALTAEWLVLVWLTPEAAYLVFPFFFLYLHVLGGWRGSIMVIASTIAAIIAISEHGTYSAGGFIGPVVAAVVAIAIAAGYRALARESAERQALINELLAAQEQLAISERERGILDERTRLAGEIHDTLAQGLSSIQMLLHAAERAAPASPGIKHIELARNTAADNLLEARRLVRELSPPSLTSDSLPGALQRLGQRSSLQVHVDITGKARVLPMSIETGLLRIAQGALGNIEQHAHTDTAQLGLDFDQAHVTLRISDQGRGFDSSNQDHEKTGDSFGLTVMRRRTEQLGGTFQLDSASGQGTRIAVEVPA